MASMRARKLSHSISSAPDAEANALITYRHSLTSPGEFTVSGDQAVVNLPNGPTAAATVAIAYNGRWRYSSAKHLINNSVTVTIDGQIITSGFSYASRVVALTDPGLPPRSSK